MKSTTLQTRQSLKKKLIWGDVATIARLAEVNRETVNRWFNGESQNTTVEAMVKAVIETRNKKVESKIDQLSLDNV